MFRLAITDFSEDLSLQKEISLCISETMLFNLKSYFNGDFNKLSNKELYKAVNYSKVISILNSAVISSINELGINAEEFISKKMVQIIELLKDEECHTFDLFNEYLLYRILKEANRFKFYITHDQITQKIPDLKKRIRKYAKDYLELHDVKERNAYIKNVVNTMTIFPYMLDTEDSSLIFWDLDFTFFDDWGFSRTIYESAYGVLLMRGYGLQYTREIFTSIGVDCPKLLEVELDNTENVLLDMQIAMERIYTSAGLQPTTSYTLCARENK